MSETGDRGTHIREGPYLDAMMRRGRIFLIVGGYTLLAAMGFAVLLAEQTVRAPHAGGGTSPAIASSAVTEVVGRVARNVELTAADEVPLRGWWIQPGSPLLGSVVVLHGLGDTRRGALGHADYLTKAGYAVLLPDLRGHGDSGGGRITYGLLERNDLARWQRWMQAQNGGPVYGIGVSLGAAILLQALPQTEFAAVVAESPFSCFDDIAVDRIDQFTGGLSARLPVVRWGLLGLTYPYSRIRFGIDLRQACPMESITADGGRTPILLVHGVTDKNIPVEHSRRLAALPGLAVSLWEVAGAGHVRVLATAGNAYRDRVLRHFADAPMAQKIQSGSSAIPPQ